MKKELGGERLNNGQKMTVDLKEYDSSNANLNTIRRTSMSVGTVVPIWYKVATPDSKWKIHINAAVRTNPTVGPLYAALKLEVQIFKAAIRLYQPELYTDAVEQGLNMAAVKLPQFTLVAKPVTGTNDLDNSQVNPSCVLKYLGISGIGITTVEEGRSFNACALLMLWDTYKNYLANKQEKIGAVIHTPSEALVTVETMKVGPYDNPGLFTIEEEPTVSAPNTVSVGNLILIMTSGAAPIPNQIILNLQETGPFTLAEVASYYSNSGTDYYYQITDMKGSSSIVNYTYVSDINPVQQSPKVVTFPLTNIDDMRRAILANVANPGTTFSLNDQNITPYKWLWETGGGGIPNILSSQEGLPIKTYDSDLFNNWLNGEWISGVNGINKITAVTVTSGEFQIPQFILKKKIFDMLNNVAVSGGSINDWQQANWGVLPKAKATKPEYEGGLIKEIVFQEVVSNSESGNQPLGTLAARGVMGDKHVGGFVECEVDEMSYLMALCMITPKIDYSQGNEWDIHLTTMDDFQKPAMDGIGFQDLMEERLAWWSTTLTGGLWTQYALGKQPAWQEYRTDVNKCFGNFAIEGNQKFMTNNRSYEYDSAGKKIKDATTYIDPVKFNQIFAYTAIDAQNYMVQVAFDINVRQKMSNRVMPML